MKKQLRTFAGHTATLMAALVFVSSCTKTRNAELPEDQQADIYAISEIPTTSEATPYSALVRTKTNSVANTAANVKAVDPESAVQLSADDAQVPARLKYMFDHLPLASQTDSQFKITFSLEKDRLTAYKVVNSTKGLTPFENSLAVTPQEVQLLSQNQKADISKKVSFTAALTKATQQKMEIKSGKAAGALLIPMFRFKIEDYGVLERTKNELKESTGVLTLRKTDWAHATHIKMTSSIDNRIVFGLNDDAKEDLKTTYLIDKIDNRVMSAADLQAQFKFNMKFIDSDAQVYTKLDDAVMHVYEVTSFSKLNEQQQRLVKNNAGNQEVISCSDDSVASYIQSSDKDCVILLKADLPVAYKRTKVELTEVNGLSSLDYKLESAPRAQASGLVQILENSAAKQVDITGVLDPDSSVRLSDLSGEFFYRRTFEDASNMFLGRTGTSGDMTLIKFELEDQRIVVRNQQSLVAYTGQGPKDREELMSFPVTYIRMTKISADGAPLAIPTKEVTTKEKAEFAIIDWTKNTVPDSNSPLAFYAGGDCIMATSSQKVTNTDMRLAKDGVLNFSISGSYTMKPDAGCFTTKDVNSAYWGGSMQFNFNIIERISFMKHKNMNSDIQFAPNISGMAQAAFNFGVFTLADKVTSSKALDNHDGSEKYMPLIHDFRQGKKIKYYIGGLNNPAVTTPERRQLIIDASFQVMKEWNQTLRYAFRGTTLERDGDYVDIVVDEGTNTGHLGDLDRNYIWFQELAAENGLLGVAQPAANPRSGTIESANVIIYSGNTYDETKRLLEVTAMSRKYERKIAEIKRNAVAAAKKSGKAAASKDQPPTESDGTAPTADPVGGNAAALIKSQIERIDKNLSQSIQALQLDNANIKKMIKNLNLQKTSGVVGEPDVKTAMNKKGHSINYPINDLTFIKKLTSLAINQKLANDPHRLELTINDAFMKYGHLDSKFQEALKVRSQMLAAIIQFDERTKNRPGCFLYQRDEINDQALTLDKDKAINFDLNFSKNIKSTLSHELGHAFGLLHNFRASTDRNNFEFAYDEKAPTGRNYSSIMDYINDIDMHYAGPGPYDAHAVRAAYTGLVELSPEALADAGVKTKLESNVKGFASIGKITQAVANSKSFVSLTKNSINQGGLIKFYEQCDDGGMDSSALCRQFDVGGSATESVKNMIADYNRGYNSRNYVYDKINFGPTEKMQIIRRNIALFSNIHGYLEEIMRAAFMGTGRGDSGAAAFEGDLLEAAKLSYKFFHEVVRTPEAKDISAASYDKRFMAVPYTYQKQKLNAKGEPTKELETISDVKILEARSLSDISPTPDKLDTVGVLYDKLFALQFLTEESRLVVSASKETTAISYIDFEKFFLGVKSPADSLTINTLSQLLRNDLTAGFFRPSLTEKVDLLPVSNLTIESGLDLTQQAAVSATLSLNESKQNGYDAFAESFKVSRSVAKLAPKDRFSVVRSGQDRSLSDSRVYFAAQNAVGASSIVQEAARNEIFVANKAPFMDAIANIYKADLELKNKIIEGVAKICAVDDKGAAKDQAACDAVKAKSFEDRVKGMPEAVPLKIKADGAAQVLVKMLRSLNSKGLIMAAELDKVEAGSNFSRQVESLRNVINIQIPFVRSVLDQLANSDAEKSDALEKELVKQLLTIADENEELATYPIIRMAFNFVSQSVSEMSAVLKNGKQVSGASVTQLLFPKDRLQSQYQKQLDAIDLLNNLSIMIDPDAILQ